MGFSMKKIKSRGGETPMNETQIWFSTLSGRWTLSGFSDVRIFFCVRASVVALRAIPLTRTEASEVFACEATGRIMINDWWLTTPFHSKPDEAIVEKIRSDPGLTRMSFFPACKLSGPKNPNPLQKFSAGTSRWSVITTIPLPYISHFHDTHRIHVWYIC